MMLWSFFSAGPTFLCRLFYDIGNVSDYAFEREGS
jgi:hypothetical protein